MSGSSEFQINETRYQWCVRAFSVLRNRLGIDISLRSGEEAIEAGQIFLFNHFARFETIIPQYFIYKATGAYCRCVATHELFEGNEHLAKILWSLGAVPNTHPGLLPFLAAEILRGRKIVIFPEGSMIKDRGVYAPSGLWPVHSAYARHRQGAAALALVLESFKSRILSVHEAGDTARLGRWVAALGLANIDVLIAAARKPTFIVPGNITFFPLHTGDNFLRQLADYFTENLTDRLREELLVEGNLILRRTDMDIRLGRPIDPGLSWSTADRLILSRAFESIDSLQELFGLKDRSDRMIQKMAAVAMRRKTSQLRDTCMQAMYALVTVNLNHLASRLILRLYRNGEPEVTRQRFHHLLYRIVKDVQVLPGVHLHRSLSDPEVYDGVHDGSNPLLAQFLETAAASGLMAMEEGHYRFLPAVAADVGERDPRLENVIRVYANEIASLASVCQAIDRALPLVGRDLAANLFDDELKAYAQSLADHSQPRHAAINGEEAVRDNGKPYLLLPDGHWRPGVVLVHGFLAVPAQLHELGQRLVEQGHPVIGVRLKGHGTSPWDLRDRDWLDWLHSVKRGYEIIALHASSVVLVGFGTGASLALQVAAANPSGLAGVVAMAAPIRFRQKSVAFAPFIHGVNRVVEWVYSTDGVKPFQAYEAEEPMVEYRNMPVRGAVELRKVAEELERRLPEITCPVHIIQATEDPVVDPDSARIIHDRIGSAVKSLHLVPSQRHGIYHGGEGGARDLVISLLAGFAATPRPQAIRESNPANPIPWLSAIVGQARASVLRWLRPLPASLPAKEPYPWEKSYPTGIDWHATISPRSLVDLFDDAVRDNGDRMCLNFRGKRTTYREVGQLVEACASGLQSLGVGRGIKVGLMLPNCPYAVICFYAVLKAGGTVVNINPLYAPLEIERQIEDADAQILITLDVKMLYNKVALLAGEGGCLERLIVCPMKGILRFTEKVAYGILKKGEIAAITEDERHIFLERLLTGGTAVKQVTIDPSVDVAVLQYTGGTTGLSKGAQLTHANIYVNTAQIAMWAPGIAHGKEKTLAVLPLFHSFGMTAVMNFGLWIGAELILLAKFHTAEVLAAIDREKPAIFIGVPTMFSALLESHETGNYDLSSLKFCVTGGAPLSADIQQRFEKLTGCRLIEGYGLSEAAPVCTVNPLDGPRPGTAGLPLPGTIIEIAGVDDPQRLLPVGERGEICVTGPQVMLGYANRPGETMQALRGGRLHTGDVGYLDADGFLHVVDRIKDLILSGGFNVYPHHVEAAILAHPAVAEAAVCGIPDSHRGETVKAFVRLRDGAALSEGELRVFLEQQLAPFELPRNIEFRNDLPRTFLGKISKKDLKVGADTVMPHDPPTP
jgi:acyl-CoA synthetase (AMP-forming)/AMP-acid ligase II/esterase/lipase